MLTVPDPSTREQDTLETVSAELRTHLDPDGETDQPRRTQWMALVAHTNQVLLLLILGLVSAFLVLVLCVTVIKLWQVIGLVGALIIAPFVYMFGRMAFELLAYTVSLFTEGLPEPDDIPRLSRDYQLIFILKGSFIAFISIDFFRLGAIFANLMGVLMFLAGITGVMRGVDEFILDFKEKRMSSMRAHDKSLSNDE